MKKVMILASAALTGIALLPGPAGSQGTPQTVGAAEVDTHKLSTGYRASKVIGQTGSQPAPRLTSSGRPQCPPIAPPTLSPGPRLAKAGRGHFPCCL
jgi:hypothetical protein